jgi:hypothetical protein
MFGHKKEKRLAKIDAKYISGHSLYAHEKGTDVSFYEDRMQFDNMNITIPYIAIARLGAQEDRHITKTRVLVTGLVGLFWKKKYRYTVIEYNDGIQDQTVILDFHKEAGKAQKIIYNQMAGARLKQKGLTELKAESEQNALTGHYKVLEDTNNNNEKEMELENQEIEKLKTEEQQSQEQKEFEEFKKWKAQQAEKEKKMMEDSKE